MKRACAASSGNEGCYLGFLIVGQVLAYVDTLCYLAGRHHVAMKQGYGERGLPKPYVYKHAIENQINRAQVCYLEVEVDAGNVGIQMDRSRCVFT